ncbi:MAG: hypothetical protein P4L69_13085 [Desulfosporosinus sp.]|nr:hypothetical protein [Desulfosporosinus sp.]
MTTNIHPFLIKQGIDSVQLCPDFSDRARATLLEIWNIDLPEYKQDLPAASRELISNIDDRNYIITIIDGQIDGFEPLLFEADYTSAIHKRYLKKIRITLAKNIRLKAWFDALVVKWNIPQSGPWDFFDALSGGRNEIFLPYVIKHTELKNDINELCVKLKFNKDVQIEFWTVAAYLLFRKMIDNTDLSLCSTEAVKLFKVQTDNGYKFFVKLSNILDSDRWEKLSEIINLKIGETDGFIPGNGKVIPIEEIISGDIPEWCKLCYVYSVPDQFSQRWRDEYKPVRKALNDLGLNYKWRRSKPYDKKTIFVIEELKVKIALRIKIDESVCKEIGHKVTAKFDPKGLEEKPYSYKLVRKAYNRYLKNTYPYRRPYNI